jgi:hypothetical protein
MILLYIIGRRLSFTDMMQLAWQVVYMYGSGSLLAAHNTEHALHSLFVRCLYSTFTYMAGFIAMIFGGTSSFAACD